MRFFQGGKKFILSLVFIGFLLAIYTNASEFITNGSDTGDSVFDKAYRGETELISVETFVPKSVLVAVDEITKSLDNLGDEIVETIGNDSKGTGNLVDGYINEIIDVSTGAINQTKLDEVITLAKNGDLSASEVDDLLLKLEQKGNIEFNDELEYLYDVTLGTRYHPDTYYSYSELKAMIKDAGLSGRAKGLEAHHLLEKQYADAFGLTIEEIISVPLTPGWHRNVNGVGINIDNAITTKMQSIMTNLGTTTKTPEIIWQAHREVYEKIGQSDWASAIYKAYIEPKGIPYK